MAKPKLPIERDKWLWVLTRTTGIAEEPNGRGLRHVTVQLPNGNLETMAYDPAKMRADDVLSPLLNP
ncbi:MAG: hypothetical protein JNK01_12965 [Devosia sp.]|jgi:hypothetical protein|nr:hypothetical protein [Devosia sp.]